MSGKHTIVLAITCLLLIATACGSSDDGAAPRHPTTTHQLLTRRQACNELNGRWETIPVQGSPGARLAAARAIAEDVASKKTDERLKGQLGQLIEHFKEFDPAHPEGYSWEFTC